MYSENNPPFFKGQNKMFKVKVSQNIRWLLLSKLFNIYIPSKYIEHPVCEM